MLCVFLSLVAFVDFVDFSEKQQKQQKQQAKSRDEVCFLYIISPKILLLIIIIYSQSLSLKNRCCICCFCCFCWPQQTQQTQQAKSRDEVCLIYIINYHNDLIIKYNKCPLSSLKNRC